MRLAVTAFRAALRAVAMRSAMPTLDAVPAHLGFGSDEEDGEA
jgi:hypothetical protein